MLKKSKLVNIICGLMIGVLLMIVVVVVLIATGLLSFSKVNLIIETDSVQAMYDGTPLTNHSWRISHGGLKNGHELKVTYKGTQTVVGESENAIEISIFDELGADVSSDYNITYNFGTLKVDPRVLVITSASAEKIYDGQPLVAPQYEIEDNCDGLVKGHIERVVVTGYIINEGKTNNTISSVNIYDIFGTDVTRNYHIVMREGLLVVNSESNGTGGNSGIPEIPGGSNYGDAPLKDNETDPNEVLFEIISNKRDDVYLRFESYGDYTGKGWKTAEPYYDLVNGAWSASYLPSLASRGSGANTLTIRSLCGRYALPYYITVSEGHEIQTSDVVFEGHTDGVYYEANYYGNISRKPTNSSYSDFEKEYRDYVYATYLNIDDNTREYMDRIIEENGFDPSDSKVWASVASYIKNAAVYNLEYPDEMDEENNVVIAFLETYKEGVCRHYASAATLLYRALGIPARYTVGAMANVVAGRTNEVLAKQAHAWVEIYVDGVGWMYVEVTGSAPEDNREQLELKPTPVYAMYDGNTVYPSSVLLGFEALEERGYYYDVTVSGERREPGVSESVIESIQIYDNTGKDVTDQFNITVKPGVIQVYIDDLYLYSSDVYKVYDGKVDPIVFTSNDYEKLLGDNYKLLVTPRVNTEVGSHLNTYDIIIVDEFGEDRTNHFRVHKNYGVLNISPNEITVKAGDAQKVYDGEALTCGDYTIEVGALCDGHYIGVCTIEGSQTDPGRSDNKITYIEIYDAEGNNVTSNYAVSFMEGKLRVTWK